MAKIIWKGVAKKDDPIYGGGFIISYPKRKSSAYLDKTTTESQKNNKDKGLEEGSKLTSTTRAEKIELALPTLGAIVGVAIAEFPNVG